MNQKISLQQFAKDGWVGVVVVLIFAVVILIAQIFDFDLNDFDWSEWMDSVSILFFSKNRFISPLPFVMLLGFINAGIGGRLLDNVTSRWGLLKSILMVAIVSWIIGVVLFRIAFIGSWGPGWDWGFAGFAAAAAGAGFVIAGLVGVIFNPTSRHHKLLIGIIASTIVSYAFGLGMLFYQMCC